MNFNLDGWKAEAFILAILCLSILGLTKLFEMIATVAGLMR